MNGLYSEFIVFGIMIAGIIVICVLARSRKKTNPEIRESDKSAVLLPAKNETKTSENRHEACAAETSSVQKKHPNRKDSKNRR